MKIQKQLSLVLTLTLLVGLASSLHAATKNSAEELSKTMLPQEQYEQMIGQIVENGRAMAQMKIDQDKLKADPKKEGDKIEKALKSTFTYKYFIDLNIKTMKESLNDKELEQILAFYETPAGKKWVQHTPKIISQTMQSVQKDLQEKMPKLVEAIGGKPAKTSAK